MSKRIRIKYIPGHGYIRYVKRTASKDSIEGDGISDIFSSLFKSGTQLLTKIPSKVVDASKTALLNIGSSAIKAVGSKVGDTIANKIANKNTMPPAISDQETRRKILKELKFVQPPIEDIASADIIDKSQVNLEGIPADLYKKFYGSSVKLGAGIKFL